MGREKYLVRVVVVLAIFLTIMFSIYKLKIITASAEEMNSFLQDESLLDMDLLEEEDFSHEDEFYTKTFSGDEFSEVKIYTPVEVEGVKINDRDQNLSPNSLQTLDLSIGEETVAIRENDFANVSVLVDYNNKEEERAVETVSDIKGKFEEELTIEANKNNYKVNSVDVSSKKLNINYKFNPNHLYRVKFDIEDENVLSNIKNIKINNENVVLTNGEATIYSSVENTNLQYELDNEVESAKSLNNIDLSDYVYIIDEGEIVIDDEEVNEKNLEEGLAYNIILKSDKDTAMTIDGTKYQIYEGENEIPYTTDQVSTIEISDPSAIKEQYIVKTGEYSTYLRNNHVSECVNGYDEGTILNYIDPKPGYVIESESDYKRSSRADSYRNTDPYALPLYSDIGVCVDGINKAYQYSDKTAGTGAPDELSRVGMKHYEVKENNNNDSSNYITYYYPEAVVLGNKKYDVKILASQYDKEGNRNVTTKGNYLFHGNYDKGYGRHKEKVQLIDPITGKSTNIPKGTQFLMGSLNGWGEKFLAVDGFSEVTDELGVTHQTENVNNYSNLRSFVGNTSVCPRAEGGNGECNFVELDVNDTDAIEYFIGTNSKDTLFGYVNMWSYPRFKTRTGNVDITKDGEISLDKKDNDKLDKGDTVDYTISIKNTSPSGRIYNLEVTDNVLNDLPKWLSVSDIQVEYNNGTKVDTTGSLEDGNFVIDYIDSVGNGSGYDEVEITYTVKVSGDIPEKSDFIDPKNLTLNNIVIIGEDRTDFPKGYTCSPNDDKNPSCGDASIPINIKESEDTYELEESVRPLSGEEAIYESDTLEYTVAFSTTAEDVKGEFVSYLDDPNLDSSTLENVSLTKDGEKMEYGTDYITEYNSDLEAYELMTMDNLEPEAEYVYTFEVDVTSFITPAYDNKIHNIVKGKEDTNSEPFGSCDAVIELGFAV